MPMVNILSILQFNFGYIFVCQVEWLLVSIHYGNVLLVRQIVVELGKRSCD